MRKYVYSLLSWLALLSPAMGADMAYKAPAPIMQMVAPLPSWSGWIVSGVVGGDWNHITVNTLGLGTGSVSPSAVAFGVKSELIYMFNPVFGVEHKLIVRYANPSVGFGRNLSSDVPYWRGDSFADVVLSWDPHWKWDAGVGIAAQTLKINLAGIDNPTYGWALNTGLSVKPFDGSNWVFGVDLVYEDMSGFKFAGGTNNNTNFGAFATAGYQLH